MQTRFQITNMCSTYEEINATFCDAGEKFQLFRYLNSHRLTVLLCSPFPDWSSSEHGQVHRQLSVSSDSKLLDDDIREENRVIMRPKKPPRPKSEVFLNKHSDNNPRRKRFSAFGVSTSWTLHVYNAQMEKFHLAQPSEPLNALHIHYGILVMIHWTASYPKLARSSAREGSDCS